MIKSIIFAGTMLGTATIAAAAPITGIAGVKNVIVLVNDGGGYTVYDSARLYLGAPLVTDGPGFVRTSVSTFPLRPDSSANNRPGSTAQDPATVYDSAKYWDTTPVAGLSTVAGYGGYPAAFRGYEFSRFAHPDSGNTATSLASGVKTYNNAINVDGAGTPATTITDLIDAAKAVGKGTGVVSTVQVSDATPAALGGAHNIARSNRGAIADEMFSTGKLDVIAGTGNPDYNDDSIVRPPVYGPLVGWFNVGLWTDLKNNTNSSGFNPDRFVLLQDRSPIQALANKRVKPPKKLAMIIKADTSSQFNRAGDVASPAVPHVKEPFTDRFNDVPSQVELTLAALNTLDQNGRGFYLMTEAGAVDRAEHANNTGRMLEEMKASNDTVKAIIDWVNRADTAATWNNTLLIVTADHDHLLYGPNGATVPFEPLQDKGPGLTPGNRWFGPNHGTGLVPLYAYGKGASAVVSAATKVDTYTDAQGRRFGYGRYADQTDIGALLKATVAQ